MIIYQLFSFFYALFYLTLTAEPEGTELISLGKVLNTMKNKVVEIF